MNRWLTSAVHPIDHEHRLLAQAHQLKLTKPAGSLGFLEPLAEQFAAWQGRSFPVLEKIQVVIFAGDHGVCQQGVSAFPQEVTAQMIGNFLAGGAAISVLSQALNAKFTLVNMGTAFPIPADFVDHPCLMQANIAAGTADFSQQVAMTQEQLDEALDVGHHTVENSDAELFIGGEMGIGNTSSASAIYAALLKKNAKQVVGAGTGLDDAGVIHKQGVIERALGLHSNKLETPYDILRCVGGFEIAGLVAAYIACAQKGIPALVDGFIATAAALLAVRLNPGVRDWLLFSHRSAEPAHQLALAALSARPLLDLGLRLGEGSGAALAVPLIQSMLTLHRKMATFDGAGVSER